MTRGAIQRMQRYRSLEIFATALGQIDLSEGRNLRPRPLLLGALAIHSYADNLLDYVRPREPYLAAGSAVEIDAEDLAWESMIEDGRLGIDEIAEVLELMIIDSATATQPSLRTDAMQWPTTSIRIISYGSIEDPPTVLQNGLISDRTLSRSRNWTQKFLSRRKSAC